MQIYPGLPPYTDTGGQGTIRIGKECKPLTGTLRHKITVVTGESDYTAGEISGTIARMISSAAMEQLRRVSAAERVPEDLLQKTDRDLLGALGLIRNGRLLRAGLLLAGNVESIRNSYPGYVWTHLRMANDTEYRDCGDGSYSIPIALDRIIDRIMADNPITTVKQGLFHFEIRTYPEIVLREALLNAFIHADYRIHGPILVKQFKTKLEISNPGGLPGGITPENILRHQPISRNPALVDALTRLRLVNRSNLGVRRMYQSLLMEGKEPPRILDEGEAVRVIIRASDLSIPFRMFVAEQAEQGRLLSVEHLLVIQRLLQHPEIDTTTAGQITQQTEADAHETLNQMATDFGYLERGGTGRGTYWTLRHDLHRRLFLVGHPERDRRIDWEAAKTRVLSVIKRRAEKGEPGLQNKEVRAIVHFDRQQVNRMIHELEGEGQVRLEGRGRGARYSYVGKKETQG